MKRQSDQLTVLRHAFRLLAGAVPLVVLACATSRFDSYMEAGQHEAAAAEFARDSSLHDDPDAVLQIAELHAVPSSPLYDRDLAIDMLEDWLQRFPDHPEHYRAELELDLLTDTRRLESQVKRLDSLTMRLSADLATGTTVRDTLEGRVIYLIENRQALSDSLKVQQSRIDELSAELRRVRQELEQLKEIDVSGK